jgi:hypothetical protein
MTPEQGMTSAHFIYIPGLLIVGVIIGWILGGRAAGDAYAMKLKRLEEKLEKSKKE